MHLYQYRLYIDFNQGKMKNIISSENVQIF